MYFGGLYVFLCCVLEKLPRRHALALDPRRIKRRPKRYARVKSLQILTNDWIWCSLVSSRPTPQAIVFFLSVFEFNILEASSCSHRRYFGNVLIVLCLYLTISFVRSCNQRDPVIVLIKITAPELLNENIIMWHNNYFLSDTLGKFLIDVVTILLFALIIAAFWIYNSLFFPFL